MAMTDTEYHQLADDMFERIENAIEYAIDAQDADVDIDASGNVLQLEFGDGSKIVINKQEPLHELWVASRFGGYHFAYVDGKWLDQRNGGEFMPFVRESIAKQSGIELNF
ncbi:frataxin [Shewanella mangrovi]|uniref:Iron-sulfur cluster assembly protein CyaY n=1 Tax=Shewanella mangrovi TaxID=1515746 RepID=A0A094JCT1_9GAMM|nr:iron donor protein CyaY [Shewanella mangrovi]KFZ37735.1 frataxin [Shewanella mangrovi]